MPPEQDASRVDELVRLIAEFTAEHGFAPTFREVAQRMVGISSTSTAQHYIERAVAEGRISRVPGATRTLRVIRQPGKLERRNATVEYTPEPDAEEQAFHERAAKIEGLRGAS